MDWGRRTAARTHSAPAGLLRNAAAAVAAASFPAGGSSSTAAPSIEIAAGAAAAPAGSRGAAGSPASSAAANSAASAASLAAGGSRGRRRLLAGRRTYRHRGAVTLPHRLFVPMTSPRSRGMGSGVEWRGRGWGRTRSQPATNASWPEAATGAPAASSSSAFVTYSATASAGSFSIQLPAWPAAAPSICGALLPSAGCGAICAANVGKGLRQNDGARIARGWSPPRTR